MVLPNSWGLGWSLCTDNMVIGEGERQRAGREELGDEGKEEKEKEEKKDREGKLKAAM